MSSIFRSGGVVNSLVSLDSPLRILYHRARGMLAAALYGEPSRDMIIIGITGTKGKTTVCNLVTHGLIAAGKKVAMFSTANLYTPEGNWEENNQKMTSPDPFFIQSFLSRARKAGCEYVVVETSSHALFYDRIHGVHYDVAALTNIAQDHLDLHRTMDNYVATKLKLFESLVYSQRKGDVKKISVINIDSEASGKFLGAVADTIMTYGLGPSAQVRAQNIVYHRDGTEFDIKMPSALLHVRTRLLGEFNVVNVLAAASILISQRISAETVGAAFEGLQGIPGRMEYVPNNRGLGIFVDYAHTEGSLKAVLKTVRELSKEGRIIVVFGATGDRDRDKRPKMGRVADEYADIVIVTDDDTYSEDSWQIIREVVSGIKRKEGENFWIVPSREDAIRTALFMSRPNDAVIFAGKGAETVQVTQNGSIPWSEKRVIQKILDELDENNMPSGIMGV